MPKKEIWNMPNFDFFFLGKSFSYIKNQEIISSQKVAQSFAISLVTFLKNKFANTLKLAMLGSFDLSC